MQLIIYANYVDLQSAGRGSRMGGGDPGDHPVAVEKGYIGVGSGAQDTAVGERGGGNGGVRGRGSFRNEIIFTRPKNLQSKQGTFEEVFVNML